MLVKLDFLQPQQHSYSAITTLVRQPQQHSYGSHNTHTAECKDCELQKASVAEGVLQRWWCYLQYCLGLNHRQFGRSQHGASVLNRHFRGSVNAALSELILIVTAQLSQRSTCSSSSALHSTHSTKLHSHSCILTAALTAALTQHITHSCT